MAKRRRASGSSFLTALPHDIQSTIVSLLDSKERLAVFRSCKGWRDVVLECLPCHTEAAATAVAAEVAEEAAAVQQIRTRLFFSVSANYACCMPLGPQAPVLSGTTCKSLQLAARSMHEVHVHVKQSCSMHQHDLQWWLAKCFRPWLGKHLHTPSLHNLTALRLQGFALSEPLPEFIRKACPGLKSYGLEDMTWPLQYTAPKRWPQLQALEISYACYSVSSYLAPVELPRLFNPRAFPGVTSFRIRGEAGAQCAAGFSKQLATLNVHQLPSAIIEMLFKPQFPYLTRLHLARTLRDNNLAVLLTAAPALQQLTMTSLMLKDSHSAMTWQLKQLHLTNTCAWALPSLFYLPRMPALRCIKVALKDRLLEDRKQEEVGTLAFPRFIGSDRMLQAAAEIFKTVQFSNACIALEPMLWLRIKSAGESHAESELNTAYDQASMHTESVLLSHLQAILPALAGKRLVNSDTHVTTQVLGLLGATCCPSITFSASCTWASGSVERAWSLMSHTHEVILCKGDKAKADSIDLVQHLCNAATRPVRVLVKASWSNELHEGHVNKLVTLVTLQD